MARAKPNIFIRDKNINRINENLPVISRFVFLEILYIEKNITNIGIINNHVKSWLENRLRIKSFGKRAIPSESDINSDELERFEGRSSLPLVPKVLKFEYM